MKAQTMNKHDVDALWIVALLAALLALLLLTGCGTVNRQYAEATSGTHAIVFPEHRRYVMADPALSDDQKARRVRLLDAQEELDRAALDKQERP